MNESRQQLYLNLINELLTCDEGEEPEILRANADLIDAELVLMMERVVSVLEERDARQQAEWLQELANRLGESLEMPSVDGREEREVYQQVRSLERRFGKGHLYFAYHAAFPLALTPHLCYQIWANFQRDVDGKLLDIPWIAVADLLLSGLCRPVGHELYEMDLAVRNLLLKELRNHFNFGEGRIEKLSEFMQEYVREQINSEDEDVRDFATVQKWTALAYVKPDEAAKELASTLREKVREGNKAELVRLASVLENLAEPLRGKYEPLLVYGRGMGRLARGDLEGASSEFQGLGDVESWLSVSRVGLPIPGEGDLFGDLARRLEWRRDNLDLIQLLLNCAAGEEGEILRRHQHLVDSVLVEMMREVAASLMEVGEGNVAEFLVAVADTLVEAFEISTEANNHRIKANYVSSPEVDIRNRKMLEVAGKRQDVDIRTEEWFNRGRQQYEGGDFLGAIASLDKALEIQPDLHEVWYNRGMILTILRELSEAIASYDKALAIKPEFYEAWYNRGDALADLEELSEAIASYDKALAIKPDLHEAWYNRGVILSNLGELSEAIASVDRALTIKADDHKAWFNRGLALYGLGQFSEAIASYDKALAIKPEFYEAWYNRGDALADLEELSEAIASYDKALAIKPDLHEAWYNRGVILSNLGELSEAIASVDRALTIKADDHKAWFNRGLALYGLGQFSEAIASYDKALVIKPDYHEAWLNRGLTVGTAISYNPVAAEILQVYFPNSPPVMLNPQLIRCGYEGQLLCYREGLKYCLPDTHPEGFGELHRAIGKAHYSQGKNNYGQRRPFYWKAVSSYNQALSTLTKDTYPELYLETLRDLIKALLGLGQVAEAQQLRRDGTDLLWRLVAEKRSQREKQQLALKFVDFQQPTVDMFVQSGQWREAWEAAEAGKNACLSWLLYAVADELPDCSYDRVGRLLREDRAIVYWHLSPIALTTFVLKYGEDGPVVVSSGVLADTAPDFTDEPSPERRVENERLIQFEEWLEKWNQLYGDYREGKKEERTAATWTEELPGMLEGLKKILDIERIETAVGEAKELILVPHRDLHRLPLHSLFGDGFVISYLPSVGMVLAADVSANYTSLLSVENPKSLSDFGDKKLAPLLAAELESAYLCHLLPNHKRLAREEATQEALAAELSKKWDIFHFSGHAQYNSKQPRKSALYLTAKERLRVEDIVNLNLEACRLVYLSSSETAIAGSETITTEYVGLVSAFLSRGVDRVVSTLWTVRSDTVTLIAIQFYRLLLLENISPIEALNRTTRWLRDLTYGDLVEWYEMLINELPKNEAVMVPFLDNRLFEVQRKEATERVYAHPYYWAAFTITSRW